MANDLLNELNRNLANAEEVGNVEWATALKARIAELEKAPSSEAAPSAAKPTVKKTVKKLSAPKKAPQKRKK